MLYLERLQADGGEVVGRVPQHLLELGERGVEVVELEKGAAEGDAGGEITRMEFEAGAADINRFLVSPGTAALTVAATWPFLSTDLMKEPSILNLSKGKARNHQSRQWD